MPSTNPEDNEAERQAQLVVAKFALWAGDYLTAERSWGFRHETVLLSAVRADPCCGGLWPSRSTVTDRRYRVERESTYVNRRESPHPGIACSQIGAPILCADPARPARDSKKITACQGDGEHFPGLARCALPETVRTMRPRSSWAISRWTSWPESRTKIAVCSK